MIRDDVATRRWDMLVQLAQGGICACRIRLVSGQITIIFLRENRSAFL